MSKTTAYIPSKQTIVVIGGGFAGLNFAKHIDKAKYHVILLDRNNFHSFPPLFYQVASSGLDPTSISFPLRREVRKRNHRGVTFHMDHAKAIDLKRHLIITDHEQITFDKAIIAIGTTNNFFGNNQLINDVYTIKSTDEAIRCRNEILYRCERAAIETDPHRRKQLLSFVVIGGGAAGVEIAGALGEIKRYILPRDYPEIPPGDMTIHLLEGSDKLLRTMSENASRHALADLKSLMVDVRLNHLMKSYTDNLITLDDGQTIYAETVIWTAGVTGAPLELIGSDLQRGPGNRFITGTNCRIDGTDCIYAIGDISYTPSAQYPHGLPQVAQVAIQQGKYLAKCLNKNQFQHPFIYHDKGSMATIGRNKAVADMGHIHLSGFPAWMAWMAVHLVSLLGMRSKINVFINWIWSYFTYNTALRLLLKGSKYPLRGKMHDKN